MAFFIVAMLFLVVLSLWLKRSTVTRRWNWGGARWRPFNPPPGEHDDRPEHYRGD